MDQSEWRAPTASGPVAARVHLPGSKSIANRALVLAALADGPSELAGLPTGSRDLSLMLAALAGLGVLVEFDESGTVQITPPAAGPREPRSIDCGLAGTVMRFVPPVAALGTADVHFDGDPRARERPMGPMISALRTVGADIDEGGRGALPFTVHGHGDVAGGEVTVDASASSQFVTALLLPAARFRRGITIHHRGAPIPSLPHIDMTVRMLREHGVTVSTDTGDRTRATWSVAPGPIRALDRIIEPDLSNAAPFIALAMVTGGQVLIPGWPEQQGLQPSAVEVFEAMGARFRATAQGMTIIGPDRIAGVDLDLRDLGELVPTLTAVAVFADGPSRLRGIGHIAGHETDRLAALAEAVGGLGGQVAADADGLTVTPTPLHGGRWPTFHDHRMATCGAIIGARVPDVLIENVATTAKTFPDFVPTWQAAFRGGIR